MQKGDGPVIAQVHPYEPIIKDKVSSNNVEHATKVMDKEKKKVVGIQINELVIVAKNTLVMLKLDLKFERAKKEKEDLAKELEKVENEVVAQEMSRKIVFLKFTKYQATCASQGQGMSFGNVSQVTTKVMIL